MSKRKNLHGVSKFDLILAVCSVLVVIYLVYFFMLKPTEQTMPDIKFPEEVSNKLQAAQAKFQCTEDDCTEELKKSEKVLQAFDTLHMLHSSCIQESGNQEACDQQVEAMYKVLEKNFD